MPFYLWHKFLPKQPRLGSQLSTATSRLKTLTLQSRTQVAQVRAEDRQGQPAPAQLLQVHVQGLRGAQARGALGDACGAADHHI